jgi:hypothetical protein
MNWTTSEMTWAYEHDEQARNGDSRGPSYLASFFQEPLWDVAELFDLVHGFSLIRLTMSMMRVVSGPVVTNGRWLIG